MSTVYNVNCAYAGCNSEPATINHYLTCEQCRYSVYLASVGLQPRLSRGGRCTRRADTVGGLTLYVLTYYSVVLNVE